MLLELHLSLRDWLLSFALTVILGVVATAVVPVARVVLSALSTRIPTILTSWLTPRGSDSDPCTMTYSESNHPKEY